MANYIPKTMTFNADYTHPNLPTFQKGDKVRVIDKKPGYYVVRVREDFNIKIPEALISKTMTFNQDYAHPNFKETFKKGDKALVIDKESSYYVVRIGAVWVRDILVEEDLNIKIPVALLI
jgi:uncharacterized protein YgiM (DUF1202 family)